MDRPLISNPNDYESKPVAGKTDWRGLVTVVAIVVAVAPVAWCVWSLHWSVYAASALAAVVAAPIGYFGLARFKGLRAEQFVPIVLRERSRPREMCWECPQATFADVGPKAAPGRREAARLERERLGAEYEDHLWAAEMAAAMTEQEDRDVRTR